MPKEPKNKPRKKNKTRVVEVDVRGLNNLEPPKRRGGCPGGGGGRAVRVRGLELPPPPPLRRRRGGGKTVSVHGPDKLAPSNAKKD